MRQLVDDAAEDLDDPRVLHHVGVDEVIPEHAVPWREVGGAANRVDEQVEIGLQRPRRRRRRRRRLQRAPAEPAVLEPRQIAAVERMPQRQPDALGAVVPRELEQRDQIRRVELEEALGAEAGNLRKRTEHVAS